MLLEANGLAATKTESPLAEFNMADDRKARKQVVALAAETDFLVARLAAFRPAVRGVPVRGLVTPEPIRI